MADEQQHCIDGVRRLIEMVGENPDREGLEKTPKRYVDALKDITAGYNITLDEVINGAIFPVTSTENCNMVLVRDIPFYSMCEHHLLPFFGICHIAYVPNAKVLGLSKLARITEMYARRLQIQERLCEQICKAIEQAVAPLGVGVVMHAE